MTKESILTPRTSLSFAVVVVLLGGLTANIRMVSAISEKEVVVATEVKAMRRDISSISTTLRTYAVGNDRRIEDLRTSQFQYHVDMAKKIAAMEGELKALRQQLK